uniref:VQ domain-containing protein n=1 Tax=Leersia perrieri TaxID=77586 RepID=A0A0D9WVS0_9ORYZ
MSSSASSSSPSSKAKRPVVGSSIHGRRPQPLIVSLAAEASRPSKKPRVVVDGAGKTAGPVIVYELTPKVFHARPEEFRDVVQKLTGKQPTAAMSPASTVRLTEKVVAGCGGESKTAGDPNQPANPPLILSPSQAAACLPSPSSLFLSPTTMQVLQELGVLF